MMAQCVDDLTDELRTNPDEWQPPVQCNCYMSVP